MTRNPVNIFDFEQLAQAKLDSPIFDYYAGGAADEVSVQDNRAAFDRLKLRPRVLVDVQTRDLTTTLLGQTLPFPLVIAPLALAGMAHPEGDLGIAQAAAERGIPYTLSTFATSSIEEIAAAVNTPLWQQLYIYKDRGITRQLVARAELAGFQALVVTVDTPLGGLRERDMRNRFRLPAGLRLKNLSAFQLDQVGERADDSAIAAYATRQLDASLSWEDIDWLRSITTLPILLKGILHPADALLALAHGAAGIIVSNHGGRQLDTTPAPIDALPDIAAALDGQLPILLDGGIRRGTDMVKAIALGASAVLIGRPALWGLAVDGAVGVGQVLDLLRQEFDVALALCGCPTVAAISPDLIFRPH
jgi:4-hydroxymandelate oxidase